MPVSLAKQLFYKLQGIGLMLVTAESCTGGLLSSVLTDIPGSSTIFERGFITYSNEAKIEMLAVPADTLNREGAVSSATAIAMAKGALRNSRADVGVAITGIAGPGSDRTDKPVGLVYIAYGAKDGPIQCAEHKFSGNRETIRSQSVEAAFKHLIHYLDTLP